MKISVKKQTNFYKRKLQLCYNDLILPIITLLVIIFMRGLIWTVSNKEWKFVLLVSVLVVIITTLPYLVGYLSSPERAIYTGLHNLTPGDTNVYLSMIEQVKEGRLFFINLYTSESQQEIYLNPFWLLTGLLAKVLHLSNLLTLHLVRIVLVIFFVCIAYLLLTYLFSSTQRRKWMLFMILFSSGLGIFFNTLINPISFNLQSTDVWVPESITFMTLYHFPHQICSLILIIVIFLLMLFAFEINKFRYSILAGVAGLFLFWFHPFHVLTIYLVPAVYLVLLFFWKQKIIKSMLLHYLVLVLIPIPAILYFFLLSKTDWTINQWLQQNILSSPNILMYIVGYGLILLFALVGLWISVRKLNKNYLFLIAWAVTSFLLLYFPVPFQRRLSEGLHIPLAILATLGIIFLYDYFAIKGKQLKIKKYLVIAFIINQLILFLPLTNIQIIGQDIYHYLNKKTYPYYLEKGEVEAIKWLKDKVCSDKVVFSSPYMGNFIPAYSGRVVWIGHSIQTINYQQKKKLSVWFWRDDTELEEKYEFLKNNDVDFIFYSFKEKELGRYQPANKSYLQKIFFNENAEIYRVL